MNNTLANALATIPVFLDHNPGRPGWTVAAEVKALADAGPDGFAGSMLRTGYNPAFPVTVGANTDRTSWATVAGELLAGLDARKSKKGEVLPLALMRAEDGKAINVTVQQVRDALADAEPQNIIPALAIHAGHDGRRRATTFLLVSTYASIVRVPVPRPLVTLEQTAAGPMDALLPNFGSRFAKLLGTWQKVQACVELLRAAPGTREADIERGCGCSRGDAQLMHRGASSIIMHRLTFDTAARCLDKEEWAKVKAEKDSDEAQKLFDTLAANVKAKRVGVDAVQNALELLPQDAPIKPRELAAALKVGTMEALNKYLQPYMV